jgi:anthranilate phosphoribosyltransferase
VRLDLTPQQVAEVGEQVGITFAFAPAFHPALRHAALARRELGIGTTFNVLGPLANPARPAAQAVGCADRRMAPLMAEVFAARGVDAWVFRGDDGLDELTTTTSSTVWVVAEGRVSQMSVGPADVGLPTATTHDLRGGDVTANADVVRRLVAGERGPVRDAVLLNAGAALAVHAGGSGDPLEALRLGIERAEEALDAGAAADLLDRWVGASAALA